VLKRFAPAAWALSERVRQPNVIRLLIGLGLIAPAALIRSGEPDRRAEVQQLPRLPALIVDVSPEALAQAKRENPVFEVWREAEEHRPSGLLAARYAKEYKISEPLAAQIHTAAVANGISPKVAFGLVRAESGFRPRVVSPVGAIGLTQLMPSTARWLNPGVTRRDLENPTTNLKIGFKYLRQLIDQYDGNERMALTAFNRGPGTVNKLLKRGRNPDNGYADKVITGKSTKHVALMNAKFGKKKTKTRQG
jgi:soluble lytic murein transglycosylase-like protein